MMTIEQWLLGKIAEEGVELAHRAHKAINFGLDEAQSSAHANNRDRLMEEINDFIGTLRQAQVQGLLPAVNFDAAEQKRRKLTKYLKYSQKLGMVEPGELCDAPYLDETKA